MLILKVFMATFAINLLGVYKKGSKILRSMLFPIFTYTDCKFYPTCSDYSVQSLNKHGFIKGLMKTLFRIIRCNPFTKGGIDFP